MSALTPQSDMPTPTTDKITQAAMETIYLCKFRVSMDGEWLCLRELDDISLTPDPEPTHEGTVRLCPGSPGPAHCSGAARVGRGRLQDQMLVSCLQSLDSRGQIRKPNYCFRSPSEFVTQPFKPFKAGCDELSF